MKQENNSLHIYLIVKNLLSKSILLFIAFCFCTSNILAQIGSGTAPYSFTHLLNEPIIINTMPFVNTSSVVAEDALITDKQKPYRFGIEIPVNISMTNCGSWQTLPNGDRIWQIAIYCKNAVSINLLYSHWYLPKGAKLHLYTPNYQQLLGAFTSANNLPGGKFATSLLKGETTILEYYEPANVSGQGIIQIEKVIHGYRGIVNANKNFGESGACNININCPEGTEWENEKRSVAQIIEGGLRACSGAMINNVRADCTPYFLTADHCLSNLVEQWIFMFNYESPSCENLDGPTDQTITGCTLISHNTPSDFTLVQLSAPPPPDYNVYYAGWSAEQTAPSKSVCIHHPSGDIKKISFDDEACTQSAWNGTPNSHWQIIDWNKGTTEPGSSGAPLFNENHLIIGQLSGGNAACNNNSEDNFGKVAMSWEFGNNATKRLKDWLDPDNTGTLTLNGLNCGTAPLALDAAMVNISSPSSIQCNGAINISAILRNQGLDTLTSATLIVLIDNLAPSTYNWTGNLNYFEYQNINILNTVLGLGTHTITVIASNPNGANSDLKTSNDTISKQILIAQGEVINVTINTDLYGEETSFIIFDEENNEVYNESGFSGLSNYNFNLCLPEGCYTFTIYDSYGDGMCCEFGDGNYLVSHQNNDVITSGATFEASKSYNFCVIAEAAPVVANFLTSDTVVCAKQIVSFTNNSTGATSYNWEFEGGEPASSTDPNPVVSYNEPGTYSVTLTANNGNTSNTKSITNYITVTLPLNINAIINNATNPISLDGTATLVVNGGQPPYFYQWNTGSITQILANVQAGNYTVTVSDNNSCETTKMVTIGSNLPAITASIDGEKEYICTGNTVNFSASANNPIATYQWFFANGEPASSTNPNPLVSYSLPGEHSVTLIVSDNFSTDTVIINNKVTVSLPQNVEVYVTNAHLNSNDGFINLGVSGFGSPFLYNWNNGSTAENLTNIGSGNYSVTVTNKAGCKVVRNITVKTDIAPPGFVLYTNPIANQIRAFNNNSDKVLLTLYNTAGQQIISQATIPQGNSILYPSSSLVSGIYIAKITINDKKYLQKLIVIE